MGWARAQGTTGISGFAAPQGEGHGFDPAQGCEGMWLPTYLGSSLAAWYKADAGCYTDAAMLCAAASSQYASRTGSAALRGGTTWWRSGFLYLTDTGTKRVLQSCLSGNDGYQVEVTAGDVLKVTAGTGAATASATHGTSLSATTWYFWYAYFDGTNIGISLNGGAAVTQALGAAYSAGTASFFVGCDTTPANYMNGALARNYGGDGTLSAGSITALYAAGAGLFYADLGATLTAAVASGFALNLCESSGDRVESVGALNLTPTNGPTVAAGPGEGLCVDNSPCKRITDQSANGVDITFSSLSEQFLWKASQQNGRPMLIPDGVNDFGVNATGIALVRVWGGVWKMIDNVALQGLLCDGTDTYSIRRDAPAGLSYRGFATSNAGDFLNNGGTLRIDGVMTDSIAAYNTANGYVAESVNNGVYNVTGFRLGVGGNIALSRFWAGGIGELYASSRVVTEGERSGMETYNRTRWGTA